MTKLQHIIKKCIASNPEIVELKFGCEIRGGNGAEEGKTYIYIGDSNTNFWVYDKEKKDFTDRMMLPSCGWEIIGRPIRLDDCARIIPDNAKCWLIRNWKVGYLDDQTQEMIDGISLRI